MAGSTLSDSPPPRSHGGIRVANYVALLVIAAVILVFARMIVVAVLVGAGLGVILAPRLQALHQRLRIPRGLAAALVVLIGVAVVGVIGWGISNVVGAQLTQLAERMPDLIRQLQAQLQSLLSAYPWLERNVASMDLAGSASGLGAALFKGAWSGVGVFSALLFAVVIGLYVAVGAREYRDGMVRAFPAPQRARADRFLGQAGDTIRNWFEAQLIDMLIIGSLTSLGLWVVGAEYWLLLGVLTGLLGIIPYVGIAIVVIFAALITLGSDASRLPWVLGVFIATQQLEGNLILPLVMRGRAQLPAVPLLVFMLLLGSWAGLLGVLIAPPLFAVLCLAYRELYLPRVDADDASTRRVVEPAAIVGFEAGTLPAASWTGPENPSRP